MNPLAWQTDVVRLPFQVRPQAGEGSRRFIIRLAEANFLPPTYLRKYLAEPPQHRGSSSWGRIAAITGRDPKQLREILETIDCIECGGLIPPSSTNGPRARTCSTTCRQKRLRRPVPDFQRDTVPCRVCGHPMERRIGQRRYMCSSHCRRVAFYYRQRGEPLPRPRKHKEASDAPDDEQLAAQCPACEQPTEPSLARRRACSRRCLDLVARWEAVPLPLPGTCRTCGDPVLPRADYRVDSWCTVSCKAVEVFEQRRQQGETVEAPGPLQ